MLDLSCAHIFFAALDQTAGCVWHFLFTMIRFNFCNLRLRDHHHYSYSQSDLRFCRVWSSTFCDGKTDHLVRMPFIIFRPQGGVRSISKGWFPLTVSCSLANHLVKWWRPRVFPVKQSYCPGLWFGQQSLVCAVSLHPLFFFFLMGNLQTLSTSVHPVMEMNLCHPNESLSSSQISIAVVWFQ